MIDDTDITNADFFPKVFEGYSAIRVVWYSHTNGADSRLSIEDLLTVRQSQQERDWSGGVLLETNGESDVSAMNWAKDTTSPCGVFSLTLLPRKEYNKLLQPDDVLFVFLRGSKTDREYLLSVISIDTISMSSHVGDGGATVRRVQVQGRDLGKVLMETPTVFDPTLGAPALVKFFAEFVKAFGYNVVQGGPSKVVQTMLSVFFSLQQNFVTLAIGKELKFDVGSSSAAAAEASSSEPFALRMWQFPGHPTATLLSLLDIKSFVQETMVGALVAPGTLLQDSNTLWSLCEMYANRCVNEFFIDVRDKVPGFAETGERASLFAQRYIERFGLNAGVDVASELDAALLPDVSVYTTDDKSLVNEDIEAVVALVHRQLPYDTGQFMSLPTAFVYETETFDVSINRSTHDVKNFFRMRMPGVVDGGPQSVDGQQVFGLTINRDSIRKHGVRWFEGESIYPYTVVSDGQTINAPAFEPTYNYYMSLFTTWYAFNERMYSGSMVLRLRPDIRVGTRVSFYFTGKEGRVQVMDLYVQGVSHNYSAKPGGSRTSLQLVRGVLRSAVASYNVEFPNPEEQLYWTDKGRQLPNDPYETVVSADRIARTATTVVPPEDS